MRRVSELALFSRRDHPEVRPVAAGARVGSMVSCVAFPDVCVPPSACDNPPDEEHSRVPPLAITIRLCERPRTGFCASAVFTSPETCPGEQRRGSPAARRGGRGLWNPGPPAPAWCLSCICSRAGTQTPGQRDSHRGRARLPSHVCWAEGGPGPGRVHRAAPGPTRLPNLKAPRKMLLWFGDR